MADGDSDLEPILLKSFELTIPVIVLGEYRYGIRESRNRPRYETWLSQTIAKCRVLGVDEKTAEEYAQIRNELKSKGRPIPGNDIWIAAIARQHGLPLISRDQHFDYVAKMKRVSW